MRKDERIHDAKTGKITSKEDANPDTSVVINHFTREEKIKFLSDFYEAVLQHANKWKNHFEDEIEQSEPETIQEFCKEWADKMKEYNKGAKKENE